MTAIKVRLSFEYRDYLILFSVLTHLAETDPVIAESLERFEATLDKALERWVHPRTIFSGETYEMHLLYVPAGVNEKKISAIKELRTLTTFSLKEAKDEIDVAPTDEPKFIGHVSGRVVSHYVGGVNPNSAMVHDDYIEIGNAWRVYFRKLL